jgi:cytoskeletal protein RodZ
LPEPTQSLLEEEPRGRDLAAELALATDFMQSTTLERENTRRRYSIAAIAALVVVVGGSLALLARSSRASDIKPTEQNAPAASGAATPGATPGTGDPHVSVESGAVQQSATHAAATSSHAESDPPTAKHAPAVVRPTAAAVAANAEPAPTREPVVPAGRMPNVKIAVSSATPDLKIVPPELLVDARTRLTNGDDQVEQGEYVTARRTFRSAILQLDSVAMRFPESQAIKSLKKDLEQADARATQACAAENEMRKRRGEQARVCQ